MTNLLERGEGLSVLENVSDPSSWKNQEPLFEIVSVFGEELAASLDVTLSDSEREAILGIRLVAEAFCRIRLETDGSNRLAAEAMDLLRADGMVTAAYEAPGEYLERIQKAVDDQVAALLLALRLDGNQTRFVLIEEVVELGFCSPFVSVSLVVGRRKFGERVMMEELRGLGSLTARLFYLGKWGDKWMTGLNYSSMLGKKLRRDIQQDIYRAISEYRERLAIKDEPFSRFLRRAFDD